MLFWLAVVLPIAVGVIVGIVLSLRSNSDDVAFDKTITHQLAELPALIAAAHEAVAMTTDFEPRFFNNQAVKASFEAAIENGASVRFITDRTPSEWYEKTQGIEIKRVSKVANHVAIIDERHIRLEKPHGPHEFGDGHDDLGLVFLDFPELGKRHAKEFERVWTS